MKTIKGKTVLVTGGAGFIGSHLCERSLKDGAGKVICFDNFITGEPKNVAHLKSDQRFQCLDVDVTENFFLREEIDFILHFASPASPKDYLEFPIETLRVGSLGTNNMLELAKRKNARFLLASTSEIYGDPLIHPQPETYWGNVNPIGPRGVYDEAKRYAEAITMAYYRAHKVNVAIARIFNTYGPKMRPNDGRAVPAFITQALANKPLTIFGDGTQTRSFCYVDDTVEGIIRLLLSDETGPINIGNPHEMTLNACAEMIVHLVGGKSRQIFELLPKDDPKVRCPDIYLARKKLDWYPKVMPYWGFLETINWFKNAE